MSVVRVRDGRVLWAKRGGALQQVWPTAFAPPTGTIGTPRIGAIVNGALAGTATAPDAVTTTVPYPAGVTQGDCLVIAVGARVDEASAQQPQYAATGWTGYEAQATQARFSFLVKIATASDATSASSGGTVAVTGPGVLRSLKMLAVAGVDTTTPVDAAPTSWAAAGDTFTLPGQTATRAGTLPIYGVTGFLGAATTATYDSPNAGAVEWLDTWQESAVQSTSGRATGVYYQPPLSSSGATGTRTVTTATVATHAGVYLLLRPAT